MTGIGLIWDGLLMVKGTQRAITDDGRQTLTEVRDHDQV